MNKLAALIDQNAEPIEHKTRDRIEIYLTYISWGYGQIILDNLKKVGSGTIAGRHKIVKRISPGELLDLKTDERCIIIIDGDLISNWGWSILNEIRNNNPFSFRFVACKPQDIEDSDLENKLLFGLAVVVKKPLTPVQIKFLFEKVELVFGWMEMG